MKFKVIKSFTQEGTLFIEGESFDTDKLYEGSIDTLINYGFIELVKPKKKVKKNATD